jgi:hypothetical protein
METNTNTDNDIFREAQKLLLEFYSIGQTLNCHSIHHDGDDLLLEGLRHYQDEINSQFEILAGRANLKSEVFFRLVNDRISFSQLTPIDRKTGKLTSCHIDPVNCCVRPTKPLQPELPFGGEEYN